MPYDYSARGLYRVAQSAIETAHVGDEDGISSQLMIVLTARDDPKFAGPGVTVGVTIPGDYSMTVQAARDALLEAAHAVLARAAAATFEELREARDRRSPLQLPPDEV